MKHFILEGKHLAPFEQFAHLEAKHHEFLQKGYDNGTFLFSGPQIPPHGGLLVARAHTREDLDVILAEEPFVKDGFMRFVSVTEYDPVQHQPFLGEWFAGKPIGELSVAAASECVRPSNVKRHFLLEGEHLIPFEERDTGLVAAHRRFLEQGYRRGHFLLSGPTVPPRGGFLVARAGSLEELNEMLAEEPYTNAKAMRFSRITEFHPAQNSPLLNHWFQKTNSKEEPMTLPQRLAAFRANFEETVRSVYLFGVLEAMRRAMDELVSSGAAGKALRAGDRMPSFTLKDVDGKEVSSRDLLAEGPLVITFYRGFWCPYCNMDLQALEAALPGIKEQGAQLAAISPQTEANGRKAQRQNRITFPILFDPGNELAAAFGLRFKLPDYLIRLYLDGFKLDLLQINGDSSWTLAMPARYVIGTDGVITYAEVSPDHTYRPDPSDLMPVLAAMSKRAQGNPPQLT